MHWYKKKIPSIKFYLSQTFTNNSLAHTDALVQKKFQVSFQTLYIKCSNRVYFLKCMFY